MACGRPLILGAALLPILVLYCANTVLHVAYIVVML